MLKEMILRVVVWNRVGLASDETEMRQSNGHGFITLLFAWGRHGGVIRAFPFFFLSAVMI